MRVLYEFETDDIKKILADKYGMAATDVTVYNGRYTLNVTKHELPEEAYEKASKEPLKEEIAEAKTETKTKGDGKMKKQRAGQGVTTTECTQIFSDDEILAAMKAGKSMAKLADEKDHPEKLWWLYKRAAVLKNPNKGSKPGSEGA